MNVRRPIERWESGIASRYARVLPHPSPLPLGEGDRSTAEFPDELVAASNRQSAIGNRQSTRGIVLIECLVYISVLAFLFTFTGALAWRARDANRDLRRASDDIVRAMQAGERWREDIRAAIAPPAVVQWDGLPVLRVPQGGREIHFAFYNGAVWRKPAADEPWQEFLPRVAASRMDSELRQRVTAWQWELELAPKQTNARVKPLFTFLAAPQTGAKP